MLPFDFDQYEECRVLNHNHQFPVLLLKDRKNGEYCVQKEVSRDRLPVYRQLETLSEDGFSGFPYIYGMIEFGGHLLVVEAFIQGKTLDEILKEQEFSLQRICRIIIELCNILSKLHQLQPPVIHRDIKLSNVILSDDEKVYLIDFESARFYDPAATQDTAFIGTSGYAAPEQYGFSQSDCRTDIFALGVLFGQLLKKLNPEEKTKGENFSDIIGRCTAIDPEARYTNTAELKRDIENKLMVVIKTGKKMEKQTRYIKLLNLNSNKEKPVDLVRDETGIIYVQKEVDTALLPVYTALSELSGRVNAGVPEIHQLIEEEDRLWIIEEYINGRTLEDRIGGQCISPETALKISIRLCEILKKYHEYEPQVIHRDIKPSNVMLTEKGEVFLIDFDAARFYAPGETKDTTQLGTAGFAPPEQFGFGQCDARSDIYALGVLINVMLTGDYPKMMQAAEPFASVIKKCTEMDSEKRYNSVDELKKVLLKLYQPYVSSEEEEEIKAAAGTKKQSWIIPGFRTKTPWKMILSVIIYASIFFLAFSFIGQNNGFSLFFTVLVTLCWAFFLVCDYRGLCSRLPLIENRRGIRRFLGILLWTYMMFCVAAISSIGLEALFTH